MTGFDAVRLVFAAWLVITVTMIVAANRWNRLLDEVRLERDVWRAKYQLGVGLESESKVSAFGKVAGVWVPYDQDGR